MKLTPERLREITDDGFLEHGDAKLIALELLANREAQPVAATQIYQIWDDGRWYDAEERIYREVYNEACKSQFRIVYTAPPAVPHVTVIPEAATLTNISQLCPLDNNLSQTDFATGWNDCRQYALTHDGVPPVIKGVHAAALGWNACRAAMLAVAPGDH